LLPPLTERRILGETAVALDLLPETTANQCDTCRDSGTLDRRKGVQERILNIMS
jgi:hypothetical protein